MLWRTGACLLTNFLLFETEYVRCLMTFICVFFHEGFDIRFWNIEINEFFDGVFVYGSFLP